MSVCLVLELRKMENGRGKKAGKTRMRTFSDCRLDEEEWVNLGEGVGLGCLFVDRESSDGDEEGELNAAEVSS